MKKNDELLKEETKKYKRIIEEKEKIIQENSWYKEEYEKIMCSRLYKLVLKLKGFLIKIKLYNFFKKTYKFLKRVYMKVTRGINLNEYKLKEYKYYQYKQNRNNLYPFLPDNIEHDYKKGLVSIVLPVYNGGTLLEKTIKSILQQTYKNFELIIVNDGSTDDTLETIKKFLNNDSRIHVIDQENQKLPISISNGFRIANGEYCMWIGADDVLHKECVEKLLNDLKKLKSDFVFPNVRLIDENDNPIKDNKWYNFDLQHPENVILPSRMYNFNVVKDNYIAPIALYKSIVVKTLEDFSANRFTVEDYEYWMKINNVFNVKHASFVDPIFDYRRHSGSLTSKAKELNISQKTDDLMLFEDFRRDYLMIPMIWNIDYEEEKKELYEKFCETLKKAGHFVLNKNEAFKDCYSKKYKNQLYAYIGDNINLQKEKIKDVPKDIYKILITDNQENVIKNFDLYITINGMSIEKLSSYNGWFKIEDIQNIFSFIDIKSKHTYLRNIETIIDNSTNTKKLSVVVCTYKRSEKLNNVIMSVINQTESKKNFELLIINNDFKTDDIYNIYLEYKKKYKLSSDFIKYFEAPIKGLSYARNVGAFESEGERILYLDDDSIAFEDLVEKTIKTYEDNPDAGVVGGQIILKLPKKIPSDFLEGKEAYWSQFLISGEEYKQANEWYEFPYGANFSTEKKALLKIGGFRTGYGRVGHNFVGGEEIVVSSLIKTMGKKVVLSPLSKVYHDVDESRYTFEHVNKTDKGGVLTRIKMEMDLYKEPYYLLIKNVRSELKYYKDMLAYQIDEKQRKYTQSVIDALKFNLKETRKICKKINNLK